VRGIQVHGQGAEKALAGQRTALNLAGMTTQEMTRGMVLAPPSTFQAASRLDVSLTLLPAAKPLKDRARVHLHAYTFETIATVVLFSQKSGQKQVSPGETAIVQLRLTEPTLLLPGDRFIVRQFSPVVTIGGGVVLDASPLFRRQGPEAFLQTLAEGDAQSILGARIARRGHAGITIAELIAETGWPRQFIESHLSAPVLSAGVARIGDRVVHLPAIEELKVLISDLVGGFHKKNPLVAGISKEELNGLSVDATNLGLAVTPATSCLAVISGNADLWTTQPGYNQDLGIYIQEANAAQYPAGLIFSLGIDPSTTSTNGSSSPRSAL